MTSFKLVDTNVCVDALIGQLAELLVNDERVKVAGTDIDGVLRGKVMAKDKFLSSLKSGGFGKLNGIVNQFLFRHTMLVTCIVPTDSYILHVCVIQIT